MFTGEPGFSAPLYETDYAPRKPRCDVLLNGSAYAPGGRPAERVTVSLRVGPMRKSFDVVGNRLWQAGHVVTGASQPEPFTVMPISYDNAFGGVDRPRRPGQVRGIRRTTPGPATTIPRPEVLDGKPLPNTEETGSRSRKPKGKYRPMAFGPVGRAWQPRPKWAGTYDQKWLDDVSSRSCRTTSTSATSRPPRRTSRSDTEAARRSS